MGFIAWHYGLGLQDRLKTFGLWVGYVFHNFSFVVLLKSLFAPWKRMLARDKQPGFNLQRFFENLTFNLISRGVGFCVRVILMFIGVLLTMVVFIIGVVMILSWVICPLVGLFPYGKYIRRHSLVVKKIVQKLKVGKEKQLVTALDTSAGKFMATHLNLSVSTLVTNAVLPPKVLDFGGAKDYADIVGKLVDSKVWRGDYLRSVGVTADDLTFAASWWDRNKKEETENENFRYFKRPGIGLELLYGYTPYLNQYVTDMATPQVFSHHLIGREKAVLLMERVLDAGNSVVVTGSPGVGKKTVCLEFARRASSGELGAAMAYRRILEFDYNSLLSGSGDLNTKKTNLASVMEEAANAGNIILVIRDIHRLTNPQVEGYDFTDVFETWLEKKELKIIAIATSSDYERFVAPNLRLRKYLEKVEVVPPTREEALLIIRDAADAWEKRKKIIITVPAVRRILEGSDKYVTDAPFPEKALDILDAVIEYTAKEGREVVLLDDVNAVLAERTGISFARLTEKEKGLLGNLESVIHERLINQEEAVSLIAKSLRARTIGVTKEGRPIGSFLFLGPTGVGKTETAKVLSRIYYGSEEAMIRFDMAQYSGSDASERLIGSTRDGRPGELTTAIKNRPASLLLLDEIEKGGRVVHNLLMTILDEGYIVDAFGKKINCQHLFIIGTSNAAAEYVREEVNNGTTGTTLQNKVIEYTLKKNWFYPEFLNRFDGVIVFRPLASEHLLKIAKLMFEDLKSNLEKKGIDLVIEDEVVRKLAGDGFNPAFGARPMRRIVDLTLGDLLGQAILKDEIKEGDKIRLRAGGGKEEFSWERV